jgi:heat-inducible transcriptional repressor
MPKNGEITQRQAKVLACIVKLHSEAGKPIASKDLIEHGYFDVSAATLRNEMQVLEKAGLITHPHTSSGRVPTDAGFRYFVNQLMGRVELSFREQQALKKEIIKLRAANAEIGRRLAKILASYTAQASFTILPEEVYATGLSHILENDQLPAEDAKEIARFFDNLDEYADQIMNDYSDKEPQTFIGKELTLSKGSDYSMIVSGVKLPSGKKGVIGLVGPKSMKYPKNISLIEYISKFLGRGIGSVILLMTIVR